MHVEFEVSWWSTKLWWRRKWNRTLIRLHLRKPGPPVMQIFGTLKFSNEKLHGRLYGLTPDETPFLVPDTLFTDIAGIREDETDADLD